MLLGVCGFFLPWYLLLFRPLKRNRRTLAAIAAWLVCMQLVNVFWMVEPPFEPSGPVVNWFDILSVIGVGGVWLGVFVWQISARALLPPRDARLAQELPQMDDPIDHLNRGMYREVVALAGDPRQLEWGVQMHMVARQLERVGDNAVDIGEQVAFLLTGEFREFTDASHPDELT